MVAFYNAKDRAIYDAGDKFVPQTKYLQSDYIPTEGISYEGDGSPVSYANSGIMSGYMTPPKIIYPPINESGGDGPVDPGPPDYGYTGPGSTGSVGGFNIDDIGEGTIDNEDEEEESLGIVDGLRAIGAFTIGGPFNTMSSLNKSINRNKQKEIDAINAAIDAQYGPSDPGLRGNHGTPGFGINAQGNFTNQFSGGDPGLGDPGNSGDQDGGASADAQSDDAAGMGGYAKGGRAGYFFGGRVNYKKGGRINFRGGGQDASSDDFGGGDAPGPGDTGGEGGNKPSDGSDTQFDGNNNNKNNDDGPKKTFFNNPRTLYENTKLGYNIPTGLTTTTPYGRLSAIMDLNKTIDDEELEGKVQFDSSIGPVNTTTAYDTTIGPTFDASYTQGPVSIGYNNVDGINVGYNDGPLSIGYNNGQATVNYSKSFAKGGRVSFKNGGLASIL